MHAHDVRVMEVDRPNRQERRRAGKSDPLDAIEAARATRGGRARALNQLRSLVPPPRKSCAASCGERAATDS